MKISNLTDATYETLLAADHPLCVSVFVPLGLNPLHYEAARIRLKNQVSHLTREFEARSLSTDDGNGILRPLREACDALPRLAPGGRGLALFRTSGDLHAISLPDEVPELTLISDRFAIEPLLPFREGRARYFVLALAENAVRLFAGSRFELEEVEVPDLPHSMGEVIEHGHGYDETIQFHTRTPGAAGPGKRAAQFHGQSGARGEFDQAAQRRFCEIIDKAVTTHFESERAPLILAGAQTLPQLYREVNEYPHLAEEMIHGGERELDPDAIRAEAWEIIAPQIAARKDDDVQRLQQAVAKGHGVVGVDAVCTAATEGRVASVFVAPLTQNGTKLNETRNRAVVETLRCGGTAQVVEADVLPDPAGAIAGVLRY